MGTHKSQHILWEPIIRGALWLLLQIGLNLLENIFT